MFVDLWRYFEFGSSGEDVGRGLSDFSVLKGCLVRACLDSSLAGTWARAVGWLGGRGSFLFWCKRCKMAASCGRVLIAA